MSIPLEHFSRPVPASTDNVVDDEGESGDENEMLGTVEFDKKLWTACPMPLTEELLNETGPLKAVGPPKAVEPPKVAGPDEIWNPPDWTTSDVATRSMLPDGSIESDADAPEVALLNVKLDTDPTVVEEPPPMMAAAGMEPGANDDVKSWP